MSNRRKRERREVGRKKFLHFNLFFSFHFWSFFEGCMCIGYMWVVRLELTSVRLMDKAEQGNRQQLSGVIMKASYGEMREGREGERAPAL